MEDVGGTILLILGIAAGLALWLCPIVIAASRKVRNVGSIAVITVLLGWTFIGWIIALAMAFRTSDAGQGQHAH